MRHSIRAFALTVVLSLAPLAVAIASGCFDYCHGRAMIVYENHGQNPATMYFHGCMDTCGKYWTPDVHSA